MQWHGRRALRRSSYWQWQWKMCNAPCVSVRERLDIHGHHHRFAYPTSATWGEAILEQSDFQWLKVQAKAPACMGLREQVIATLRVTQRAREGKPLPK